MDKGLFLQTGISSVVNIPFRFGFLGRFLYYCCWYWQCLGRCGYAFQGLGIIYIINEANAANLDRPPINAGNFALCTVQLWKGKFQ